MTGAKHTPGPWDAKTRAEWEGGYDFFAGPDGAFTFMADVGPEDIPLINAAPDLLELSLFLIERLDDFERDPLQEDDGEYALRQWDGHVAPAIERLRDAIAKASPTNPLAETGISIGGQTK